MVGVEELASAQQDLFVYPNPSKGHIHVESKADIPGMYEMKVYNINGIQVYSTDPAWVSEGQFRLNADISSLPAGTYFIRLLSDGRDNGHGRLLLIE